VALARCCCPWKSSCFDQPNAVMRQLE
jgi:hypothetical protein